MNLNLGEMIFIFVLALLILGPKRLPEVGRTLGKAINEFKRATAELKGSLEREMQNLEQDVKAAEAKTNGTTTAASYPPHDPAETTENHGHDDYSYTEHRD